jgi:hypothetical protein
MMKALQYLNAVAMCLLALNLSGELMTQVWPGARLVESVQGQDAATGKKMVLIDRKDPLAPVRVVKVTENGETTIPGRAGNPEIPGQRFIAGEDWLSNLSFVVRNRTSQNIAFIIMGVVFPEDQHYDQYLMLGQVPPAAAAAYFHRPGSLVPKGTGRPLNFGPGQEVTISVSDYVESIMAAKRTEVPFPNLTKCSVLFSDVYFEDQGLRWAFGMDYMLPDADSPQGYRRLRTGYFPGDPKQDDGPDWTDFRLVR